VNDSATVYVLDVDTRQDAFETMNSTSTRALGILKSSGVPKRQIADAASIVKKLRGERVVTIEEAPTEETPLLNPGDVETEKAGGELAKIVKRSVSQLSFDSRTEHLSELIKFLSSVPNYNPNEPDLTIAALTAYINTLSALNHNVNTSGSNLQKSRRERNVLLYGEVTGLLDLTRAVKSYVKGVFGYNAPETKEVNRIVFRDKA